ncbi:MAG TPA: NADH-quinone oxidoreductase subunit L [Ktedonobacterales bacterium]|jgi:NADH-quinone oxidoreductase subunit L|nr:NADH-quinone oxidoreductase subunit L [Ktedonobacterales bacterium]
MLNLTPFILLAPLVGFVWLGLFGRVMPRATIAIVGCASVLVGFALALADFVSMLGVGGNQRVADTTLWTWISAGVLHVSFGVLSDPLSAVMLLVVTGVGFLIHVYSIGYMEDDPGFWRFFSFLNFFVFAMALLVAADNFLFLLVGWAGVGLASFLLIGFWYTRPSAVAAARKAFVVNVIGDFGLMIAIFLLFGAFHGALDYQTVLGIGAHEGTPLATLASTIPSGTLLAIALMLFVAAAAKSAQLPLHVWLPDAMEGPTPVSALIHAATMVTAGVYLVARAHSLFTAAPTSLVVVAVVAGASAFFAATIACVQTDIKRILAYSTMSQLAYMFMGEAAGGFSSGIFHLVTHAFFKALLFMCAGAVIHALGGEQDIRKMGGLHERLNGVFWLFVVSGLALAAIFPFAGFWSKDAILGAILQRATTTGAAGWYALYAVGLLTAGLTGFYIFRLIFVTFFGSYRGPVIAPHGSAHVTDTVVGRDALAGLHRPGPALMAPMYALGVLSLIGGALDLPGSQWLNDFLSSSVPSALELASGPFWISLGAGLICALVGVGIAWGRYGHGQTPASDGAKVGALVVFLRRRWYVDDIYDGAIVRPILALGRGLRLGVEDDTLEAGSRGLGEVIGGFSAGLRGLQTGFLRNYTLTLFLGAVVILVYFIAVSQ